MATLLELRRRVRSVKNMRQITRAMKLVAGAKLRRSQEAMLAARPYSDKLWEVLGDLAQAGEQPARHPLLTPRAERRVTAVVITSDRGLCGAFNSNVIKYAHRALDVWGDREVRIVAVGRKGWDHFRRLGPKVERADDMLLKALSFPRAAAVAQDLIERFVAGETDAVYLIYNEFVSALRQHLVVEPLVPIHELPLEPDAGMSFKEASRAFAVLSPRTTGRSSWSSTSTSRAPRRSSTNCCRASWRRNCIGPCSNRARPSTRRGWRPWTTQRRTQRS